jgi:carbon-monoxide dehydrogenase large subunit
MIGTNRYIGSPVERIEDPRFLRGRGEFVGDLRRDGMLHAAILRSPMAHGRVVRIDTGAALAIPGIRAVITATEIGAVPRIPLRLLPLPGTEPFLQPVIAAGRVRYVGEPIAVVLADSPALAEDGVGAIGLDTEGVAGGRGSPDVRTSTDLAVRGQRHQRRDDIYRDEGRCRRGVS